MPKYIRYLFSLILLLLVFIFSDYTYATPLSWNGTYPYTGKSGYIKFSSNLESNIYAAVDKSGQFDILKSSDNGFNWLSIKSNLPNLGDINWISDFPDDPNIIAISLWGSGVFLTENGGATWNKIFDSSSPRSVQINPSDLNTIYVGLGGSNSGPSGLYKSINKGSSWDKITEIGNGNVAQINIDPKNNSRIFVDSDPNFYRSDDDGNTWSLLSLKNAYTTSTIIDKDDPNTIYTGSFQDPIGFYVSTNSGQVWKRSPGLTSGIFDIGQSNNGNLFVTQTNSSGGVWMSSNKAETWENIQDPAWGDSRTWGLDVKGNMVAVSVEGHGLYIATISGTPTPTPTPTSTPTPTPTPTPLPGPNPIVVIPGFGGSFSTKGLLLNQETNYTDWQMMPIQAPSIYNPFLNTLGRLNYLRGDKVFFFAYDFRKTIAVSGSWLNQYLENEVLPKNQGRKADIVGHSMGGLVARYCFEKVNGCKDKINKIVTAGTPHQGAVADYAFWEGGDLSSLDPLGRAGAELYLTIHGGGNKVQAIQLSIPGAKDFMPIHNYIVGKPYTSLSGIAQNPVLENLPLSTEFSLKTLALSGNNPKNTDAELIVKNAKPRDLARGSWIDGEPKVSKKDKGDGTVLATSSNVPGALNKSYKIKHIEYLNKEAPVSDILKYLGLSPIGPLNFVAKEPENTAIYYTPDPSVEVNVEKEPGEEIIKPDPNVVFVKGGKAKKRNIILKSKNGGDIEIKGLYYNPSGDSKLLNPVKVKLFKNTLNSLNTQFN